MYDMTFFFMERAKSGKMTEREQYMQAYATVLDLEVTTLKEYVERKGMLALIKNPDELL